jgi:hypothetical protein
MFISEDDMRYELKKELNAIREDPRLTELETVVIKSETGDE